MEWDEYLIESDVKLMLAIRQANEKNLQWGARSGPYGIQFWVQRRELNGFSVTFRNDWDDNENLGMFGGLKV